MPNFLKIQTAAAVFAFLLPVTFAMAQDSDATADEAETQVTMAEVEQAWNKGDFVFVREGLKYLAEETGTPLAQYRYGRVLVEGRGGPPDMEEAARWLEKAVDQDEVAAMTLLARVYLTAAQQDVGIDTGPDEAQIRAAELFARGAALGEAEAQYYLALLYQSGVGVSNADAKSAFNWFLAASKQDHVEAQYELSRAYAEGIGTEADTEQALKWLTEAAENGHVNAQYFLAVAMEFGQGSPRHPVTAVSWYLRAAEGGLPVAQRDVGTHYLRGEFVDQNTSEGLHWLQKAATAGEAGAMANLGFAYATGMGVERDDAEAVLWYERARQYGLGRAITALAAFYQEGRGVEQDLDHAIALYREALTTRDKQTAMVRLGHLAGQGALDGKFAPHHAAPWALAAAQAGDTDAESWLAAQAENGLRPAVSALAELYLDNGERGTEGADLLVQAATSGDVAAQVQLGQMYMIGELVELDYIQAHKWFNIAAAFGHPEAAGLRDTANALMTPDQVAEAQTAARTWFESEQPQPPQTEQEVVKQ